MRRKKVEEITKPTRYYSTKQEESVSKTLSIRRTSNSGATLFDKGDLSSDNCLFECKTKTKPTNQITIKKEWLEKNKMESITMNKEHSILVFNYGEDEPNYYILDEITFRKLFKQLENK